MSLIQINQELNVQTLGGKPNKAALTKLNKIEYWESVEADRFQLAGLLQQGFSVRGGIKINGNEKVNIRELNWIFIDIDGKEETIEQSLENVFTQQYAAILWQSPSYSDSWQKHRIGFECDRSLSIGEYEDIVKYVIMPLYKGVDRGCFDAGRLWYSTVNPLTGILILDDKNLLPVNELVEIAKARRLEKTTTEIDTTVNPQSKFLEYLYTDLYIGKLGRDISKLYNLYEHEFKLRALTQGEFAEGILQKAEGSNPFSRTNSSGTSFVVSEFEENLPVWYDRSGTITVTHLNGENGGGTLIDYWYLINHIDYPNGIRKHFKTIFNDICDHYGLPRYKFRKTTKEENYDQLIEILEEVTKDQIYRCGWENKERFYYTFNSDSGCWNQRAKALIYQDWIIPKLTESGKASIDQLSVTRVKNKLMDHVEYDPKFLLQEKPQPDFRLIPFKNGCFNTETKELIDLREGFYNWVHPIKYTDSFRESEIESIKQLVFDWFQDDSVADLVWVWLALNALQSAIQTGKTLGLVGESGTGKTTFGKLIRGILGKACHYSKDSQKLFNSENKFVLAELEGVSSIYLEEFSGLHDKNSTSFFKGIAGDRETTQMWVEKKFQSRYKINYNAAITFDYQGIPNFPSSDKGFYVKRLTFVKMEEKHRLGDEFFVNIYNILEKPETLGKLLCYFVNQNRKDLLEKFRILDISGKIEKDRLGIRTENDVLFQFISENYEITDNNSVISMKGLYSEYRLWSDSEGLRWTPSAQKFSSMLKQSLTDFTEWKGEIKQIRSFNGKGITGIKPREKSLSGMLDKNLVLANN